METNPRNGGKSCKQSADFKIHSMAYGADLLSALSYIEHIYSVMNWEKYAAKSTFNNC